MSGEPAPARGSAPGATVGPAAAAHRRRRARGRGDRARGALRLGRLSKEEYDERRPWPTRRGRSRRSSRSSPTCRCRTGLWSHRLARRPSGPALVRAPQGKGGRGFPWFPVMRAAGRAGPAHRHPVLPDPAGRPSGPGCSSGAADATGGRTSHQRQLLRRSRAAGGRRGRRPSRAPRPGTASRRTPAPASCGDAAGHQVAEGLGHGPDVVALVAHERPVHGGAVARHHERSAR